MIQTDGTWHEFSTEEQARSHYKCCNVRYVDWVGPGHYYAYTYSQRCPRNCCDDYCVSIVPAAKRVEQVREGMQELAKELKDAKGFC